MLHPDEEMEPHSVTYLRSSFGLIRFTLQNTAPFTCSLKFPCFWSLPSSRVTLSSSTSIPPSTGRSGSGAYST